MSFRPERSEAEESPTFVFCLREIQELEIHALYIVG